MDKFIEFKEFKNASYDVLNSNLQVNLKNYSKGNQVYRSAARLRAAESRSDAREISREAISEARSEAQLDARVNYHKTFKKSCLDAAEASHKAFLKARSDENKAILIARKASLKEISKKEIALFLSEQDSNKAFLDIMVASHKAILKSFSRKGNATNKAFDNARYDLSYILFSISMKLPLKLIECKSSTL